ncbi:MULTISPECIES: hypothetical protein [unclassified Sphingomonas]|jgi:hypothetical protein|uniref:hypothetical protein n=1 Tax=unclassified Sphingomonas TaxID=196159 RepID=UPI0006F24698|nr:MULTISPECIES: hypothetical protein [unclassified Sphingomonas]KQM27824.1 hypothetical protein ASE58_05620 [Sphingomonas sp. Leaf9]KQM44164.1 hypothetical protein ASE57_05615 [Sphingomonas sp. Leaf11]
MSDALTETRHREIAVEHLLFWTMRYVEQQHPGLLDSLEASLDKLGDPSPAGDKDDNAVRHIAAKMIAGARG